MRHLVKLPISMLVFAFAVKALAEVNFVSYGGAYSASQQKAYADTFSSPESINFINYNGGLGEIRTQVESGNVSWDVVDVLGGDARIGCDEGLFEKLPVEVFAPAANGRPIDEDLVVERPNDCVAPAIFWSYVVFYEEGAYSGELPSTVADFFDVDKFPGKRGIQTWPNGLIEMALVADGIAVDDVYDVLSTQPGIDRAFTMLDKIKNHSVFWSSGAKPLELVKSGEVTMSIAFNGRVGAAILSEDEKFHTLWDGQVLEEAWFVVVKGAPNKSAAIEFLVHATAPEQQAAQARYINYGPMRASAIEIISEGEPWFHNGRNVMEHIPNRPELMARSVIADSAWWADYGDSVYERYSVWMNQ